MYNKQCCEQEDQQTNIKIKNIEVADLKEANDPQAAHDAMVDNCGQLAEYFINLIWNYCEQKHQKSRITDRQMIIAEVKNDLSRKDSIHKSYNNLKSLSLSIVHNLSVYYLFKLSKYTLKK